MSGAIFMNKVRTQVIVDNQQAIKAFRDMEGAMTRASLTGNLMASGITAGLGAAVSGAKALGGAFSDAANTSMSNIGTAGDLMKITGMSFEESSKDVALFTEKMSALAKDLPGSSEQFVDVGLALSDSLAIGLRDVNGELDKASFDKYRESLATFGAMRASFSDTSTQDVNLFISKLLDQKSLAELKTLKFAENNVGVISQLEKELAASGKELKDLSKRETIELANTALSVQDEVIEAAKNSTSGIIAGFRDGLLNKNVGLFGVMRDLDTQVEGNQSVFSSFERIVKKIFGENGLFARAGKFLKLTGLDSNPMAVLASGLGRFGIWIEDITDWFSTINAKLSAGGSVEKILDPSELATKLGTWMADRVNSLFSGQTNASNSGSAFGEVIAAVFTALSTFLTVLDWSGVGMALLEAAKTGFMALWSVVTNLSWSEVGTILVGLGIAAAVALAVMGMAAIAGLAAPFIAAGVAIAASIVTWGLAAVAAVGGLVLLWRTQGEAVAGSIARFFNSVNRWVAGMINKIPGVNVRIPDRLNLESGQDSLANKATGLDQMGLFAAIAREKSAAPGTNPVVANDSEAIIPRSLAGDLVSSLNRRTSSTAGNSLSVGKITINAGTTTNPEALAEMTLKAIERKWNQYSQSRMAPSY